MFNMLMIPGKKPTGKKQTGKKPTKKPTGNMPTGKNAHREKYPQGKMPTRKNAHKEKCPQGKMPKRKNAHMYNSFKIVTVMSAFVRNRAMRKGILRSQKSWKKTYLNNDLRNKEIRKKRTMKRRNIEIYNACSNYFVISWRFLFMLVTCG